MFGHMQEGTAKVYDPAGFPALLRMDTGSQQDPQVHKHTFYSSMLFFLQIFHFLFSLSSCLCGAPHPKCPTY